MLNAKRSKDVKWRWEDFSKTSKGDSGWYLQTTYSKTANMIRKNTLNDQIPALTDIPDINFNNFVHDKNWTYLLDHLVKYKSVRDAAINQMESLHLLRYGTSLAQATLKVIKTG